MCRLSCTAVLARIIASPPCKKVCILGPDVTSRTDIVYDNWKLCNWCTPRSWKEYTEWKLTLGTSGYMRHVEYCCSKQVTGWEAECCSWDLQEIRRLWLRLDLVNVLRKPVISFYAESCWILCKLYFLEVHFNIALQYIPPSPKWLLIYLFKIS